MSERLQRALKLAISVRDRQYTEHIHLSKAETEDLAYAVLTLQPASDDPNDVDESKANTRQVGGDHYGMSNLQHWDLVDIFSWDYFQGQITKYLMRWKTKNGVQDLEKAAHFLEKYIEIAKKKQRGQLDKLRGGRTAVPAAVEVIRDQCPYVGSHGKRCLQYAGEKHMHDSGGFIGPEVTWSNPNTEMNPAPRS